MGDTRVTKACAVELVASDSIFFGIINSGHMDTNRVRVIEKQGYGS